ncbi:MAG: type II toxin-antitoxin system RelE/ParE family toxin [Thermoanaerobaculaceae bacterium]|jgi:mRNA-degrading endonuclease RelE of RelBE toxin-antitoxin system|nr:type II toxin-antitoxin system RelE/ParE family toxin [Thermoanaerobaculaceae bacterium]
MTMRHDLGAGSAVEDLREEPLRGEQLAADWKGLRRLRVGRYRAIYAFNGAELLILVVRVGPAV